MRSINVVPEERLALAPVTPVGAAGVPENEADDDETDEADEEDEDEEEANEEANEECLRLWEHYEALDPARARRASLSQRLELCTGIRRVDMACLMKANTKEELDACAAKPGEELCKLAYGNARAIDALAIKRSPEGFMRDCAAGKRNLTYSWTMCTIDATNRAELQACNATVVP